MLRFNVQSDFFSRFACLLSIGKEVKLLIGGRPTQTQRQETFLALRRSS